MQAAESSFLKLLQKYYKLFSEQHTALNVIIENSRSNLDSILNLSEQYACCGKVDFQTCCLAEHPDLKENLEFKIITALECKVKTLTADLSEIEKLYEKLQKLSSSCTNSYNKHKEQLDLARITEGEPTRPSIAELFEWSHDLTHHFYVEYSKRKHVLGSLNYENQDVMEQCVKDWKKLDHFNKTVQGLLLRVKLFIKEEL